MVVVVRLSQVVVQTPPGSSVSHRPVRLRQLISASVQSFRASVNVRVRHYERNAAEVMGPRCLSPLIQFCGLNWIPIFNGVDGSRFACLQKAHETGFQVTNITSNATFHCLMLKTMNCDLGLID
jgi:hypothetical protein